MKKDSGEDRTLESIRQALNSSENKETTEAIYSFGQFLLRDHIERSSRIDAKASAIAGYSGAALTLIASTFRLWKTELLSWPFAPALLFFAILSLCLAGVLALIGRSMYGFVWFTWQAWIGEKYLNYPDQLKRYHILGMCEAIFSRERMNARKARKISWAERSLLAAGILLAVMLLTTLWKQGIWDDSARFLCRLFLRFR